MYILVACLANSNSVGNIVPKFGVITPRLNVMGLNVIIGAAFLTGAIVSVVDGVSPLAVLAGIAPLVGVLLTLGCVSAILATILHSEMSVGREKGFIAPMTGKDLARAESGGVFAGARSGTRLLFKINPLAKGLPANHASSVMAVWAVITSWVVNSEWLAALFAVALKGESLSVHTRNYTTNTLERWATMTGKTPELLP